MLKTTLIAGCVGLLLSTSAYAADCNKMADERKLAGAARTSFVKKCETDAKAAAPAASAACEKSASDKKLAGAARTSHIRKCMADEAAKKKP